MAQQHQHLFDTPHTPPKRHVSMPCSINLSFSPPSSSSKAARPLLPLSISPNRSPRSTVRRISYNLKTRAEKHSLPLAIAAMLASAVLLVLYLTRTSSHIDLPFFSMSRSPAAKHLYAREYPSEHVKQQPLHGDEHGDVGNGMSFLVQDEEELIAEDDVFWDSYVEPVPLTEEEKAAEAELQAHRADVIEHDRQQSLRALIWWLAEGGMFPDDWEIPSKSYLKKIGGRGMERLLMEVDNGEEEDEIFEEGWADFANKRYRITMFSKSYCPYSKNAKSILDNYFLTPAPFVIELDQRVDCGIIQTLLKHLTGRRTVPNLLLDFVSFGGSDEMTLAHAEGGLQRRFEDMRAVPSYGRRRKAPLKL